MATFGSLGMVLIMWLEAAVRSKVICQEVQSPDWDGPLGIIRNVSFSLKHSPRRSHRRTAEQRLGCAFVEGLYYSSLCVLMCSMVRKGEGTSICVCRYAKLWNYSTEFVCEKEVMLV